MSARPAEDARLRLDLRLFFAYRFLSTAYLFAPALMFFFQERGLSYTKIAFLNTVYAFTAIVCEVPTGALADRFGRRRAMIAGALLMAAGCLVNFRGTGFWTFAVGEGLLALGLTLSSGADSAYLYDLLRDSGQVSRYRALEGRGTAAKLIGGAAALLAGGLVARHHLADTYAATAAVCAVAAVVAALLGERTLPQPVTRAWFMPTMLGAGRLVLRRAPLRAAILFSVVAFTLLRMGVLYLQPPWLTSVGLDVGWIGAVLAVASLFGALAADRIETVRRHVGERTLVFVLPLALGLGYLALGTSGLALGLGVLLVHAIANGIYSPLSKELLNREITDSTQRATVLSVESMGKRLLFGLFAPCAGFLVDGRGLVAGLQLTGALGIGGALLLGITALFARRKLLGSPGLTPEAARSR